VLDELGTWAFYADEQGGGCGGCVAGGCGPQVHKRKHAVHPAGEVLQSCGRPHKEVMSGTMMSMGLNPDASHELYAAV
jgi:hypothetical protein